MSTDPRIEAAARAVAEKQNVPFVGKKQCGIAEVALAAADAVDPLRNPTDDDIERVEKELYEHRVNGLTCLNHPSTPERQVWCCPCGEHDITESRRKHMARAVVAALRGETG